MDPHGGPQGPIYAGHGGMPDDLTNRMMAEGATLRFGVVTAVDDVTTHDTGTVTVNGIRMPHLVSYSPQGGDWVAWLEMESIRLCIGEYGTDIPRIKVYLSTGVSTNPISVATPQDVYFDSNATTEFQRRVDHSHSVFPWLIGILKTGTYDVDCRLEFGPGDGSVRALMLELNGGGLAADWDYAPSALFPVALRINGPLELLAGDNLNIALAHNASTPINVNPGPLTTYLSVIRRAGNV